MPRKNGLLNAAMQSGDFTTVVAAYAPDAVLSWSSALGVTTVFNCTVTGVRVTMLKAFFDEAAVLPNPAVAGADGGILQPYTGPALTVGGELNKLAGNLAVGRASGGVHWRSDNTVGLLLGEAVALGILADERRTYNEQFGGFSLTTFAGKTITV